MTGTQTLNQDQIRARFASDRLEAHAEHHPNASLSAPTLLHNPRLALRGNAPVRAALMQSAQQTHGNRAVQRVMHAQHTASEPVLPSLRPVQRWYAPPMDDAYGLKHGGNLNPASMLKTPTPAGPVPIPYPNMGASPGGSSIGGMMGGGFMGGFGGMMGGMMGGGMLGGLGGMMGGLGGILGGLAGGGGSMMSNGDEAGTMNEMAMFRLQQASSQGNQQFSMMSNIMKKRDEMQMSIIGNLR